MIIASPLKVILNLYPTIEIFLVLIQEQLFGLYNEYWVSFYENGRLLDKKFTFEPNTIKEENTIDLPFIGKKGVLLR